VYNNRYKIADLDCRPIFENWTYTQDAGSGNVKTIESNFFQWAKIENRTGGQILNQDQQQWQYDSKIIVRYNPAIVSTTTMVYENARYTIQSLSIDSEGTKRFMILRCVKVAGDVVNGGTIIPAFGPAYVYNYDGTGGEDSFTGPINKTVFGATKDGIAYEVIFTGTVDAAKKQVLYTASTGLFTWSQPFAVDEHAIIQYI